MDKIGFVIHTKEIYNHYANVMGWLNPDDVHIVVYDKLWRDAEFMEKVQGKNVTPLSSVLGRYRYRYLVTNHYMEMMGDTSLIKHIGECNIRFMYGLGDAKWNYAQWNNLYDYILCFGPYQVERLSFTSAVKLQMGYPRYDAYFGNGLDREELLRRFGCNPAKRTVLWMPTRGKLSSVPLYLPALSRLAGPFNIIVKPHPVDLEEDSAVAEPLRGSGLTHVVDYMVDNTLLFYAADYVLTDYGGTIFSALYLDKNILLLDVPGAEQDENMGSNSEDIVIRNFLQSVSAEQSGSIGDLLAKDSLWNMQRIKRSGLRKMFFAPYYGCSAPVAASTLSAIREIENCKGAFRSR